MALTETARLIASLELKDQFSAPASKIDRSLTGLDRHFADTGSRAYKAGQQVGTGIRNAAKLAAGATVLIGTAATGLFVKSLQAASDLGETVSKVGVVFKNQAAQVLAFGKTSAAALGLSENAALAAAATYGNLFVSMGLASNKSAEMSIKLVKLAGDLASFNNIDPGEALEKLRAGLTGESEPLKTLGINLNEQTLKAKALELGLVKLTKGQKTYTAVLPPAIKAQAAYALIFEQSKTAQGDFARTSGGLANQIRILKANFGNLMTTLATPTLPKVALIFQRINAEVLRNQPAIAKLGDSIAGLFTEKNINAGFKAIGTVFDTIKAAAPVLQQTAAATLSLVKSAVGLFQSLPPEIQKLAVGAFAINKLTGGLVTNIAGGLISSVLKQLVSGVVNVQGAVVNVGGVAGVGGGTPIVPGAGTGIGSTLKSIAKVAVPLVAAEMLISGFLEANADPNRRGVFGTGNAPAKFGGPGAGPTVPVSPATQAAVTKAATEAITRAFVATKVGLTGGGGSATRTKDDRVDLVNLQRGANALLSDGFRRMVEAIKSAKTAEQIRAAIKTAIATVVTQGRGNVQSTVRTLNALKAQLKNTHDPKLRADLNAAIKKVADKLPGRQFAQQQLDRLRAILADNRITNKELREVQSIEKALKDRGLPTMAKTIADRVQAAQRAIAAASREAGQQAAFAIRDKDLSVNVKNTVNVAATFSVTSLNRTRTTFRLYGSRYID